MSCDILITEVDGAYSGGGIGLIAVDLAIKISAGCVSCVLVFTVKLKRATRHLYRTEKMKKVTQGVAVLRIKAMKYGSYKARFARQVSGKTYCTHSSAILTHGYVCRVVVDCFGIA